MGVPDSRPILPLQPAAPLNVAQKQRSAVWMIIRCIPLYLRLHQYLYVSRMPAFIPFPPIQQFRNVLKELPCVFGSAIESAAVVRAGYLIAGAVMVGAVVVAGAVVAAATQLASTPWV